MGYRKKQAIGFGFIPEEAEHHFLVVIPRSMKNKVIIYERFHWQRGKEEQTINRKDDKPKVELSRNKWDKIAEALKNEFNKRLDKNKITVGRWKIGQVPVERLLGKEMVLLAWAIEDCDPAVIPTAIKNWLGLKPEERWWLFTMTNAVTGGLYDKRGWRKAIRYALTENPIEESHKQYSLFYTINNREDDLEGGDVFEE